MRKRASVLCIVDGQFLAVQERGRNDFSLPGGGGHRGEQPMLAAIRELKEETGSGVVSIEYLTSLQGQRALHCVFLVTPMEGVIKDRGIVYVDSTAPIGELGLEADKTVQLKTGNNYIPESVFPEPGWLSTWDNMGKVLEIEKVQW